MGQENSRDVREIREESVGDCSKVKKNLIAHKNPDDAIFTV
jgi:hypothetical protein